MSQIDPAVRQQLLDVIKATEGAQYTKTKPNGKVLFVAPPYAAESIAQKVQKHWEVGSKGDYNGMPSWVARPRCNMVPATPEAFQKLVQDRAMAMIAEEKAPSLFDATNAARNALEALLTSFIANDPSKMPQLSTVTEAIASCYAATTSHINSSSWVVNGHNKVEAKESKSDDGDGEVEA